MVENEMMYQFDVQRMLGWELCQFQKEFKLTNEEMESLLIHILERGVFK